MSQRSLNPTFRSFSFNLSSRIVPIIIKNPDKNGDSYHLPGSWTTFVEILSDFPLLDTESHGSSSKKKPDPVSISIAALLTLLSISLENKEYCCVEISMQA